MCIRDRAATGRPYDTLEGVIGLDGKGKGTGTLMDYGIRYDEAPLKADFTPDYALIAQKAPGAKVCHIQRSRGYLQRNAFDLDTIQKIADTARAANPEIIIFVDNCYGEFTQMKEPCQAGADLVVGSLIKNPGGGIAPTGGYIAGRKDLVELCAYCLLYTSQLRAAGLQAQYHPGRFRYRSLSGAAERRYHRPASRQGRHRHRICR